LGVTGLEELLAPFQQTPTPTRPTARAFTGDLARCFGKRPTVSKDEKLAQNDCNPSNGESSKSYGLD
jgi:hypothetical protein